MMNTTELLALFREEVFDLEVPYLWSDALVYGYIDDAQKQFCRDTYGIADARSSSLAIVAGTEWYPMDPRILKVRGATNSATGRPVPLVAVERMESLGMYFDGAVGSTRALITGLEENMVRAWPMPNAAATINLSVFRLSADAGEGDDLEVGAQHQRSLLHWIKHRAYDVQDAETYNKGASAHFRAVHDAYCAKALIEQSRARHSASAVAYGGI